MTVRFTKEHEWVRMDGDVAVCGITAYAAEQLGDVVFVELPGVGKALKQNGEAAVVESVKAASDVYAPVTGEVVAVNEDLSADPAKVNADPQGAGWFFKVKLSNRAEFDALMTETQYAEFVKGL